MRTQLTEHLAGFSADTLSELSPSQPLGRVFFVRPRINKTAQGRNRPWLIDVRFLNLPGNWESKKFNIPMINIGGLARRERQRHGIAECIDNGVDLGRQPAAGSADGLILAVFFWAPALC